MHTDASAQGLGAILLEKQSNHKWASIGFFSQCTNVAEKNHHSFELEMLAIVRAVERFHIYLYGIPFKVITDCNSLVHTMTKVNINPRIARWSLQLQHYSFETIHREEKRMVHVDALSRYLYLIGSMAFEEELIFRQLSDPKIRDILEKLEIEDSDKFALVDGLVYKIDNDRMRFLVPEDMISNVIRVHHDNMGHCDLDKTVKGILKPYWFAGLKADHIENCIQCIVSNLSSNTKEGDLQNFGAPTRRFEIVHLDHFGPLKVTSDKFRHILVIVDAFSRFTCLYLTKSTSSFEVCSSLIDFFSMFGNPDKLVSDTGTAYFSREFRGLMEERMIHHRMVAVASPWANGLEERVNKFLKSTLTKVCVELHEWRNDLT